MTEYSSDMIASQIGASQLDIEDWADEFEIPFEQKGVSRNFHHNAMEALKAIKNLKDKSYGFQTIRRTIDAFHPATPPKIHKSEPPTQHRTSREKDIEARLENMLNDKFAQLNERWVEFADMAEKYAQANYTIGQMATQYKQLEEDNSRLVAQLKMLPSPDEWYASCEREKLYKELLYELQERVDKLEDKVS